ncbi:MAG: hypothetical protein FWE23_05440 [Chitinivibrionia bacterium]|nr:hypothetical protein [Chitinivibrionia bacterium]
MKQIKLTDFENKSTLNVAVEIDKTKLITKISGDISQIDFPKISPTPTRKNELWTIGCFEIFVSQNGKSYNEYNFGFDENWECFNFSDYRENQSRPQVAVPPKISCEITENLFVQKVEFGENIIGENLFSITAAIKLKSGEFLYFANKHCGEKADFHIAEARALII